MNMGHVRRSLSVLAVVCAAATSHAAESVDRPEWGVGETWSYRSSDALDPGAIRTSESRVLAKSASGYDVALKGSRDGERVQHYNLALAQVTKIADTPERERRFIDWPLTPGKT
jgi:hypothetical protein